MSSAQSGAIQFFREVLMPAQTRHDGHSASSGPRLQDTLVFFFPGQGAADLASVRAQARIGDAEQFR